MKKIVFIGVLLAAIHSPLCGIGQSTLTKKQKRAYSCAIEYVKGSSKSVIVIDSTNNGEFSRFLLSQFVKTSKDTINLLFDPMNESWMSFLNTVDDRRHILVTINLTSIEQLPQIRVINRDVFFRSLSSSRSPWTAMKTNYGDANGWIELSDILFSKNKKKAIIAIRHTKGELDAASYYLLLERKQRRWQIMRRINISVS